MSDFLTINQVAEKLGLTRRSVQRLIVAKKLRATYLPSATGNRSMPRIKVAALEAYVDSGYSSS